MPEYPDWELCKHVLFKGTQVGAVAGLLITPVWSVMRRLPVMVAWQRALPLSAALFTTISACALYKKQVDGELTNERNDDRAFRILHNESQVKIDRYATFGACAGLSTGAVLGRAALRSAMAAGVTGIALGVIAFGAETAIKKQGLLENK